MKGQTSHGLEQRSYRLKDIRRVAFGARLNVAERFFDRVNPIGVSKASAIGIHKDLKAGRLIVESHAGDVSIFHFIDKAFDRQSLLEFLEELVRESVNVEVVA